MPDGHRDPWHGRHPEWARIEAEQHRRADRRAMLRLRLGLALFAGIALCAIVASAHSLCA